MTLGISLLLIFILYLIDKHNRWRQAVKLTIGLIVLSLVALGGFYGWQKYSDYQSEKEQVAYRVKMQPLWDCEARNSQFSNADAECEKDSTAVLHAAKDIFDTITPDPSASPAPKSKIRSVLGWAVVTDELSGIYKRCYFNTGVQPCGLDADLSNGGEVASLHKGDRVQLLSHETRSSDGSDVYEVQFEQWTGWINASEISVE